MQIDWTDYHRVHSHKPNLLIHLLAVPVFIAGFVAFVTLLVRGQFPAALLPLAAMLVSLALQGFGHSTESERPRPFSGFGNFLSRWFTEQFIIFPLFVLTGRWWRQLRAAPGDPE